MYERQFRVVAVSDINGGIYNASGLDIPSLDQHLSSGGTLHDFIEADFVSDQAFNAVPCDVFVPATIGDVLDGTTSRIIDAKVVMEGANHPTTPEGNAVFLSRGIPVIPDILVNGGGVTVSYFEWTQNIQQYRWDSEIVDRELTKTLANAYTTVRDQARQDNVTWRDAALTIAIQRVARAIKLRDFV